MLQACRDFLPLLCDAVERAVDFNARSMSDTQNAGVVHASILGAVDVVRAACPGYQWDCVPGRWLIYTLLLAMPFPAKVVRPDPVLPVWTRKPRRGRVHDLSGAPEPAAVPALTDAEAALPEAVGHLWRGAGGG